MTSNKSKKTVGNDEDSNENDRPNNTQKIWRTVKGASSQIDLQDVLYYCISAISIVMVPLSAIGLAFPYYELAVNIRPVSESILDDLNCTELNITSEEVLDDSVCSMDTFLTQYSLYHRQVNYFHFSPAFGVSFCDDDEYAYTFLESWNANVDIIELPDDTEELIGGKDIGHCKKTEMLVTASFAALTMGFVLLGLLWLTVSSSHSDSTRASNFHIVFCAFITTFSVITIALYSTVINPLRPQVNPSFCDEQTSFRDCEENLGLGFYCQISIAILSFLAIAIHIVKAKVRREEDKPIRPTHHHVRFYKNPHFYIKLGRFSEFVLATVAGMINFTTLKLLLPDVDDTPISMSSYLWGDQFCSDAFFAADAFHLREDADETTDMKNFGDCYHVYRFKVIFTIVKIIGSAGAALFLKRDAAKNPFIYLGGLVADVATVVLVIMAIWVFMIKIYPGRSGIEPSFCDQYSDLRNAFLDGDEPQDVELCNISLGPGFYILCAILPLTVVNLLVEFIVGERGSEYGAVNAFQTVVKRLKRKEYQDAMFGPSSFYRDASNASRDKSSKLSDEIQAAKEDGTESTPPETHGKALGNETKSL